MTHNWIRKNLHVARTEASRVGRWKRRNEIASFSHNWRYSEMKQWPPDFPVSNHAQFLTINDKNNKNSLCHRLHGSLTCWRKSILELTFCTADISIPLPRALFSLHVQSHKTTWKDQKNSSWKRSKSRSCSQCHLLTIKTEARSYNHELRWEIFWWSRCLSNWFGNLSNA